MKRGWILVLLVSLGLNLGLAWKVVQSSRAGGRGAEDGRGERTSWLRTAPDDSAAWQAMFHRRLGRITDRLALRPEQAEAFSLAQRSAARTMHRERLRVAAARRDLFETAAGDSVDPAALRDALAALRGEQARLDSLASEFLLLELEVLDPEQRARYLELLPLERGRGPGHERWPGRGGRGRGGPPGKRQ